MLRKKDLSEGPKLSDQNRSMLLPAERGGA
jgi:hypothetical protein